MNKGWSSHLWSDWLVWMNIFQIAPKPSTNMQLPSKSDHRWLLQPSFIISPILLFLASGLYLKHFFRIFGQGWALRYWGLPLQLIWYHFDRVVIWHPRSTLTSGLIWLVWMNIFQIVPKPSTIMPFPSNSDHKWLLQPSFIISPISLFLASGLVWLVQMNIFQIAT